MTLQQEARTEQAHIRRIRSLYETKGLVSAIAYKNKNCPTLATDKFKRALGL